MCNKLPEMQESLADKIVAAAVSDVMSRLPRATTWPS